MADAATSLVVECQNCKAKNRVRLDAALARLPVCGKCGNNLPTPAAKPIIVTDQNFAETVAGARVPVLLLDMWAAWCGPCRMIAPTIEALAKELAGRAVVGKLDVDANPKTAARFQVQSIPTLLILQNGREVDRLVGLQSREAIIKKFQRFL
ncbi:MAG: thioredoxin [Pyrinomonadaceae bacterium]